MNVTKLIPMELNCIKKIIRNIKCPEDEDAQSTSAQELMLMHLHEQFAINHSQNLGSLITLFVSMLGVLWAYGAVLLDTDTFHNSCVRYEDQMIFVTLFANLILTILVIINVYQGFHVRKDQFVIHRIRNYYKLSDIKINDGKPVVEYSPLGKTLFTFITGLYGLFTWILISLCVFIDITTFFTVRKLYTELDIFISSAFVFILICFIVVGVTICYYKTKYDELANGYADNKQ